MAPGSFGGIVRTFTADELKGCLECHAKWLDGTGGARADLGGANLSGANLSGADLGGADLIGANFSGANLRGANFSGANLSGAYLSGANLSGSYLSGAYLIGADLGGADLSGTNFSGADLFGADLSGAKLPEFGIPEGDLTVWKKINGTLVKLLIPEAAKRTASLVGRKCRAEFAKVVLIEGAYEVTSNGCGNGPDTVYRVGEIVRPDSYDDDIRIECSHGIHFFLTRGEAERWSQ